MDNSLTSYAMDYITYVCKEFGPRISGTREEKASQEDLLEKLEHYCDHVGLDEFKVHPTFYPGGFVTFGGVLIGLGVIPFFWKDFWPILAIIMPFLALFIIFVSLFGMKYWFAFLSKTGTSYNAMGRIKPRDEENRMKDGKVKVVIAGHIDSAFQMRITRFGDRILLMVILSISYVLLSIMLALIKIILVNRNIIRYLFISGVIGITWIDIVFISVSLIGMPVFITVIFGLIGGKSVLGANDNLSGVAVALTLAKLFSEDNNRLKNVELWIGAFGSEECGERGSEAFIKKYSKLDLLSNAHAVIPESIGGGTNFAILSKENMHFVKHDIETCNRLQKAYNKLKSDKPEIKFPCAILPLKMAASDAGRFALAGYKSTTLIGYEGTIMKPPNWHAETDDPAHINREMLGVSIEIFKNYLLLLDEEL